MFRVDRLRVSGADGINAASEVSEEEETDRLNAKCDSEIYPSMGGKHAGKIQ